MSWQALTWAIQRGKDYELEPTSRHVLLTLANYADPEGNDIYPSLGTLGADTGLSEATLRRHIKHLIRCGLLAYGDQSVVAANAKIRADKRPKCYRFVIEHKGGPRAVDFGRFGTDPGERPLTERPRTVNGGSQGPVTGSHAGSHSETQTDKEPKKPLRPAPDPLTPEQLEAGRKLREDIRRRNESRGTWATNGPKTEGMHGDE